MNSAKFDSLKLLMAAIALVGITACGGPKQMAKKIDETKVEAVGEVLEVHGDSVIVAFKGKIPAKTFNKKSIVKFEPVLRYGGSERRLPTIYLKGEKVKNFETPDPDIQVKTISYNSGGSFDYYEKIEYTDSMKKANLTLDYAIKIDSKYDDLDQCLPMDSFENVTRGTVTTSLTVKPLDSIYMMREKKPAEKPIVVPFYFVINEWKLRDSVMRKPSPSLASLRRYATDTTMKITRVELNGYASPDGEMDWNDKLTEGRAETVRELAIREFRRLGNTSANDSAFVSRPDPNAEDWAGLARLVQGSDLPDKEGLLGIIGAKDEDRMRAHAAWPQLKADYLPRLRRTEVVIYGGNAARSCEELMTMFDNNQHSNFTMSEFRALVWCDSLAMDTTKLLAAYQAYKEKYPDDVFAQNNYAAIILRQGQYETANQLFTDLRTRFPNSDTVRSNLGVSQRFLRFYDDARDNYMAAQGKGIDEANNLGILYIKYGFYDKAVDAFPDEQCDYNTALAYTLKGEFETALTELDCIEKRDADWHYLRAIIFARMENRDGMITGLARAVSENPAYKDIAKEDLEFRKYWDDEQFKQTVK